MAKSDPEREAHKSWLGLVQPVGLVVSPPALLKAQVILDKNITPVQQALAAVLSRPASVYGDAEPQLLDFPRFATQVLGWSAADLAGAPGGPPLSDFDAVAVPLPDYGETLRPSYLVLDGLAAPSDPGRVLLLVLQVEPGVALDAPPVRDGSPHGWPASPQARIERLLRDTGIPAGLLVSGTELRLVYAPRGESSGQLGFPIPALGSVSGRPLLSALHMLLSEHRVFSAPDGQRLLDLLRESRKYQSEVSTRLAEQVLHSLWELLRGFAAADEAAQGRVLYELPRTDPEHIYGGLLTTLMRLVFLLYAEDQGLMPDDPVYASSYSVSGLFERLREDAARYPDTLDQRFGAYAWLLSTFRMVFDGGAHGTLHLPTRHGQLFNPDEYPFLEGRPLGIARVVGDTFEAPRISDGVLWRVLSGLLVLDGERLSYRALDVEQVGSVYESMMGFDIASFPGRALCLRPKHIVVDLDALLAQPGAKRAAWLKEHAECDLPAASASALKDARTVEEVTVALGRRVAPLTPQPLPPGALFLQPGQERRRSGSHYTPRELTEPIVRTTLRPLLQALGERPTPEQLLELKVCDPAMGSGAFLVEACRQLAASLVAAWDHHRALPKLPPDEDPLLHARRLVAQRCLYGVDKNPFAVNLAKLSLWLVTLAKEHAFTFLDHALKHGDSLVGLSLAQLGAFHWDPPQNDFGPLFAGVAQTLDVVTGWRHKLHALGEGDYDQRRTVWRGAEDVIEHVRQTADLCLAAYFGPPESASVSASSDKSTAKQREARRQAYLRLHQDAQHSRDFGAVRDMVSELKTDPLAVLPLHWQLEFPEVFGRVNPGFDAIVGNPPFMRGKSISTHFGDAYRDWLAMLHVDGNASADLVAHFFRRAFGLLRRGGTLGLIATNTIAQGDTRATGLRYLCTHGGEIFAATRRLKWPGMAAVVVSIVHVSNGPLQGPRLLDDKEVPFVSAFLFAGGGHEDPHVIGENADQSFQGSIVLGIGFTFDDTDKSGTANSITEMHRLIAKDPRNQERIFPYIGGEELNTSPTHQFHRYVINFGDMTEEEARSWPDLMAIVEEKVKPERDVQNRKALRERWWQYADKRPGLTTAITKLDRVLCRSLTSKHFCFAFCTDPGVLDQTLIVFAYATYAPFAVLSSRCHEVWASFFGATMKDDPRYNIGDCFETFPFPEGWQQDTRLEAAGQAYYQFRAALMVQNREGLTKTYNRFHDPHERDPQIQELRQLHAALDRAVLDAYGFTDLPTTCDFYLDYDIDEATWGDKKKPYRYRYSDAVRDDLLARLLDLNQSRHQAEQSAGPNPQPGPSQKAPKAVKAPKAAKVPKAAKTPKAAKVPKAASASPVNPTPQVPLLLFPKDDVEGG